MPNKTYTPLQKTLHWLVAFIVIPMVMGSFFLKDLSKAYRGPSVMLHKSFGLVVLSLMIIRILYVLKVGRPNLPSTVALWEKVFARVVQYSLYLALVLMPLCGWMMATAADHAPAFFNMVVLPFPGIPHSEALSNWLFQAHRTIAFIILGLLFLHISGAVKHHFFNKDKVLVNMLPAKK